MYIKKEIIEKIKDEADILQIIGEFVELKKKGAQYMGLSPFVTEKSASFSVNTVKGVWKCFSSGKGGAGAISFLMEMPNGMTYPEALKHIANKLAITVEYENTKEAKAYAEKQQKKAELMPVMVSSAKKFHEAFLALPDNHPAKLEVFHKRKYSMEVVKKYQIGYAPGNNYIYDLAVNHGVKDQAQKLGLIKDDGDKWYNRVIYPLLSNQKGLHLALGIAGRSLSEDKKYAKWINNINTDIYQKESYWYGLNFAKETISKKEEAYIVEGYNDVISLQINGKLNTIAPCGTAIATKQITTLKKFCKRVIFCMDPDTAGKKSVIKYVEEFMKHGFRCFVIEFPKHLDPDEFTRFFQMNGDNPNALDMLEDRELRIDGFKYYLDYNVKNDPVEDAIFAEKTCGLIQQIDDKAMQEIYLQWLAKETDNSITLIRKFFREREVVQKPEPKPLGQEYLYDLPDDVNIPIEKLLPSIQRYQMFQANNKIYMQRGTEAPYYFSVVSNFSIEIIQHMSDEEHPKKLVRIRNVHGKQSVFDMPSEAMNTPNMFENAVTAHGNYQWRGDRKDHQQLKFCLFDSMGTGRQVEIMGWQPEGFWVWNNLVVTEEGNHIQIDENGCFDHKGVAYYVPSANSIYATNAYKYESQKRFISIKREVTLYEVLQQMRRVHSTHGLMGGLFAIASVFQDIAVKHLNCFPILFLYGPPSTGKDQLADGIQSFLGIPQTAINLEGGTSTAKAQIREFAQFGNGISQLSEYKPGDPKLDGLLKGLWDRRGYKRGSIESKVATDSIPILASTVLTANFVPDQEALITRFVWCLMDRQEFTEEDSQAYDKLSDIIKKGYSHLTNELLTYRLLVENNFKEQQRAFRDHLKSLLPNANARMLTNLSVFGAIFKILESKVSFPYNLADITELFVKTVELQMNKLSSASIINRFWDCFLASLRGHETDILQQGRDFNLEGDKLFFHWTNAYNKIQRQWYIQYKESIPSKTVLSDAIQKEESWVDKVKTYRYGKERVSSAFCVCVEKLPLADDINLAIQFQRDDLLKRSGIPTLEKFPDNDKGESPVTPDEKNNLKDKGGELPF